MPELGFIGEIGELRFIGEADGSGGGTPGDSANHILTEAGEILTTEAGDHLVT